jgi:predicted dehydrogenase
MESKTESSREMDRRTFLASAAAAGTGLAMARESLAQEASSGTDDLNIAMIGVGRQGRVLMEAMLLIPGLRFRAICDIWPRSQQQASGRFRAYGQPVNVYEDYREMLDKEKDLDAAIIATPDWMHAEHAIACLEAGLHVYCEKEMSNSLEKAREMVLAARRTGQLMQIGHQRRSNPRYIHAIDTLMHKENLLGRVTQAYGQWNRAKRASEDLTTAKKLEIDPETLKEYGYDSMAKFLNWRVYRKYGGGPIVDLGSHQIDIFSWVFRTNPKSVVASGGIDFFKHHEWYDNVMTIYEYENELGTSRAFYQVLTTTSHGGFAETFMGEEGTIKISEIAEQANAALKEENLDTDPKWNELARKGLLVKTRAPIRETATKNVLVDVRESPQLGKWPLPVVLAKKAHQPHLENFFEAIRHGKPLNCPPEIGYETAVAVLKVNEAVEAARKLEFKEEDFHV